MPKGLLKWSTTVSLISESYLSLPMLVELQQVSQKAFHHSSETTLSFNLFTTTGKLPILITKAQSRLCCPEQHSSNVTFARFFSPLQRFFLRGLFLYFIFKSATQQCKWKSNLTKKALHCEEKQLQLHCKEHVVILLHTQRRFHSIFIIQCTKLQPPT